MTKTELLEIISNGENSGVEFKRDDVRPEDLAKECVALANLKGGIILLGVEDDKSISGLTRSQNEIERWIMDTVFGRYISPSIIPYYEQIIMDDGKIVGIIKLEQGISKPYTVVKQDRSDIYIRVGSLSKLASREQILRLIQDSGFHTEVLPVSGSRIEDLDIDLFSYYLQQSYNENISQTDLLTERLRQLDLLIKDERYGWICSLAGILLFGKNPGRFLNQSGIKVIGYNSIEPDYSTFLDEQINLHIAERRSNSTITRPGLLAVVLEKLAIYLSTENINQYGIRERIWKYPFEVLRELIVNAVIHRDYTKRNVNKIEIFPNRIEITSFGSLPNTLTLEKVIAGQQYPRNPLLIRVVKDYGYMEDKGLGIRRKVIPLLKEQNYPDPVFEATEDYFKVTIFSK